MFDFPKERRGCDRRWRTFPKNRCSRALFLPLFRYDETTSRSRVKVTSYEIDRNRGWLGSKVLEWWFLAIRRSILPNFFVVEFIYSEIHRSSVSFYFYRFLSHRGHALLLRNILAYEGWKGRAGLLRFSLSLSFFTIAGAFIKHSPFIFLLKSLVAAGWLRLDSGRLCAGHQPVRPRTRGSNSRSKGSKP